MTRQAIDPILDPRGRQERPILKLAPRVTLETLRQGPVLFYNNGKLSAGDYSEIFRRIKEYFGQQGISNFIDYRETARGKTTADLKELAGKLVNFKPVAVINALGDIGVSPATAIITIEIENLGIPAVYITAPPGHDLAKATAFYRAGRLCLCPIDVYQGSTRDEIREKTDALMPAVMESLTLPADKIMQRAQLDFPVDIDPPAENGLLRIEFESGDKGEPDTKTVTDYLYSLHIGDGLPVIPPTESRVHKMLEYCPLGPETVLVHEVGPSGKNITVKDVAIGAVMAGAEPQYMPVLLTAFKAFANPKYNFLAGVTTSHPGGNLILVSGPLVEELGIHGGQGCLGPGFKANMTIGRAVNLIVTSVCRSVPSIADLACLSSPAEIAYCFAEDPKLTPWNTINAERYDSQTTTVTVLKAEPPHDLIDFLSRSALDFLDTVIDSVTTLGTNNAYIPGNLILVFTPDHAQILSREGWDKNRIREHIHNRANNPTPMVRNRGLDPVRPKNFDALHPIPVTRTGRDIDIVVAGGRGGHSAVILPWALYSEAIYEPVLLPDGSAAKRIEDFRKPR